MRASTREGDETSKAKIRMSVGMLLGCVYVLQDDSTIAGGGKKHAWCRGWEQDRDESLTDAREKLFLSFFSSFFPLSFFVLFGLSFPVFSLSLSVSVSHSVSYEKIAGTVVSRASDRLPANFLAV